MPLFYSTVLPYQLPMKMYLWSWNRNTTTAEYQYRLIVILQENASIEATILLLSRDLGGSTMYDFCKSTLNSMITHSNSQVHTQLTNTKIFFTRILSNILKNKSKIQNLTLFYFGEEY